VNGVFQATEILAKHDETYMPSEVIDALKEQGVYVEPES
jgi:cytochrome c-type biogenesis protein CcmE